MPHTSFDSRYGFSRIAAIAPCPYCFQIFTADLRSHVLWSPLSGTVVEVNQKVLSDPEKMLQDPYGEGWLLRIKPSSFDRDVKAVGL